MLKFKDTPRSNDYLQNWIDHMGINDRFGGIYVKEQLTTDMIKQNKFYIINLDDFHSVTNGTHWRTFYYNENIIEYFDSYGLKPPQIISQNSSYTYNNTQYQSHGSKACGYYCLYFIYQRYHRISYYDIVKRFSLVDLEYNQNIIMDFFNNYN